MALTLKQREQNRYFRNYVLQVNYIEDVEVQAICNAQADQKVN